MGLNDGTQTEVQSAELHEGMTVVIGEQMSEAAAGGAAAGASPFTPQMGRARGSGGGGGGAPAGRQ